MKSYIKILLSSSIISVLTLSFGCTTTEVKKQSPTPGDVVAEWPKMQVGDTWYTTDSSSVYGSDNYDNYHYKVARVEEDGSFDVEITSEKREKPRYLYHNSNYPMMSGVTCVDFDKHKVSFPLFVGKEWDAVAAYKPKPGLNFADYKTKYKCLKFERIKTRAGEFKAFKIKRITHNVSTGWRGQSYFWYSPKIKVIIKSKHDFKKGMKLISYSLFSNVK